MKIQIISAMYTELDELIRHYPCLCDFGFEIKKEVCPRNVTIKDENGNHIKFEFDSTTKYTPYIEMNTIEDFFKLGKAVNKNLLFRDDMAIIQIADEWRK